MDAIATAKTYAVFPLTFLGYLIIASLIILLLPVRYKFLINLAVKYVIIPSFRQSCKLLGKIPRYNGHWLYGSYFERRNTTDYQREYADWAIKNNHKLSVEWLNPVQPCLNIHDPHLLMNTANSPRNCGMYCSAGTWIGKPTMLSSGKSRVQKRKLLNNVFNTELVANMSFVQVFTECSDILITKWKDQGTRLVCVQDDVSKLVLDALLRCNFSTCESDCTRYGKAIESVKNEVFSRLCLYSPFEEFQYKYLSLSGWSMQNKCRLIHKQTMKFVKQHQAESQKNTDILDMVMNNHECKLENHEVQSEMDSFMFLGLYTSASTISQVLYYLAKHQEMQLKCRDEINMVLGSRGLFWDDDIDKLEYVSWFIKETMRFQPPIPELFRTIPTDTMVGDYLVPKQTTVCYKMHSIHFNPDFWTDPEVFDPSRFDPTSDNEIHPYAYLPFSVSPRNCPAEEFTMNLMIIVVSLIVKSFDIQLPPATASNGKDMMLLVNDIST